MNIPIYFNSMDAITEKITNNSIPEISDLSNVSYLDKDNLKPLYNYAKILGVIEDENPVFYVRNRDKDQYLKIKCEKIANFDDLSNFEKSMNSYNILVPQKLSMVKTLFTKLNTTNFNGENDNVLVNVNRDLENLTKENTELTKLKQLTQTEILEELSKLSSRIFDIKKENKGYYNELKKRYNNSISLENYEQQTDLEISLEKEKYLAQKEEVERTEASILLREQELFGKEKEYLEKKSSLLNVKRHLKELNEEKNKVKVDYDKSIEKYGQLKEVLKKRNEKYDSVIAGLSEEEQVSRKAELDEYYNTKVIPVVEAINKLKEEIKVLEKKYAELKEKYNEEREKWEQETENNEKYLEDKQELETKKEELESLKDNLERLSKIFESEDIVYNSLMELKEKFSDEELNVFSNFFRKMNDKERKQEYSKFKYVFDTSKANIEKEREKLEEEQEYLEEIKNTYLKNKKTLENRRIKLEGVLKSESVLNPTSEEERLKNNETIRKYQETTKKVEKQVEEQYASYKEKDIELIGKINVLDRQEELLNSLNEILSMTKGDLVDDIKKIKKTENKINIEEFKTILESIETNKIEIFNLMNKIHSLEKEFNVHFSNTYQYNTGTILIEEVSRNVVIEEIMSLSSKNKTKELAEGVLNKQIQKLKLKLGGYEFLEELEYIENEDEIIPREKLDYRKLKNEIKKLSKRENKVNLLNKLGLRL